MVEKVVERVIEKPVEVERVVEKPVIRRIHHTKTVRNPVEMGFMMFIGFLLGLLVGYFL